MIKTLGGRRLGVTSSHKKALMRNMATSLFLHEKIETTIMKAKELRPYAEKLITHAKNGKHFMVRREIHNRTAYKKLFDVLATRYQARAGGYTRILRLGARAGDNAETGLIQLVQ
ncbi:MAG: 50S ribosomal protein L17 [Elusimicrobia bacterium]|nr:50S ribosomal protein L17 [Elusimicrobiota bacterium]